MDEELTCYECPESQEWAEGVGICYRNNRAIVTENQSACAWCKKQFEEPEHYGPPSDKNTYVSRRWGKLDFFPTKTDAWKETCRHCLLWDNEEGQTSECLMVCCRAENRSDGRNGYFAIHQMPKIE